MQDVASRIENIENSLEKIRQLTQTIQEKPSQRQMDWAPTFDEHIRTLVRVQELIQNSSDRLHELPR